MPRLMTMAEQAHFDAMRASRRAIRAGDLAAAERWMKLARLHWKCAQDSRAELLRWRDHRKRERAREARLAQPPPLEER